MASPGIGVQVVNDVSAAQDQDAFFAKRCEALPGWLAVPGVE